MKRLTSTLIALVVTLAAYAQEFSAQVGQILSRQELTAGERLSKIDSLYNTTPPDYATQYETFAGPVARFIAQQPKGVERNLMQIHNMRNLAQLLFSADSLLRFKAVADEAILLAQKVGARNELGDLYVLLADHALRRGNQADAQEYNFLAIDHLTSVGTPSADRAASRCYYQIANNYLNTNDLASIRGVIGDMRRLCAKYDNRRAILNYDYNSVLAAYYASLCAEESGKYRDSLILAERTALKNYYLLREQGAPRRMIDDIVPAWNYYNIALAYDMYSSPPQTDSMEYYLDMASKAQRLTPDEDMQLEVEISLCDLRAWVQLYKGNLRQAEQLMNETIALIDSAERITPNSVVRERSQAYLFLVDLYEQQGRYSDALAMQRLYHDNEQRLFDLDKSHALHEIEVRHQVEKKEAAIVALEEQNRISRQRMWYTLAIAIVLFVALVLLSIVFRLHKINTERKLYEKALENEIARESSEAQLHHSASQGLVDKLKITVLNSSLPEEQRTRYAANLDAIDFNRASAIFSSSHEPLTQMDRRYILCFLADMTIQDISLIFNVETASIYTVRYRVKKKFPKSITLPF